MRLVSPERGSSFTLDMGGKSETESEPGERQSCSCFWLPGCWIVVPGICEARSCLPFYGGGNRGEELAPCEEDSGAPSEKLAGLLLVGGHELPAGSLSSRACCDWNHPCLSTVGLGPIGKRVWPGECQGRGPLPGPQWVGQRPQGSGCKARPSVAATINMFVQGKPGWELCAPAR